MSAKKRTYQVDFSVKDLTLYKQNEIFKWLINFLDFEERQKLTIKITDLCGGQHFIWDKYGIDPAGTKCKECNFIECADCPVWNLRNK